jgi:hypothetical protein
MKMQTKPFVVEHKSHRRHERHDEKSIWAGVDLAAVAEDVADDLPAEQGDRNDRDLPQR